MAKFERYHNGMWITIAGGGPIIPDENNIGIAGAQGFGVGTCPAADLPVSFTPMTGYDDPAEDNYGNYEFTDGSVCVWIPAFWCRFGSSSSPRYADYGVNSVDVKPLAAYVDDVAAAVDNFYLHRAFVNGGTQQPGFFRSKYTSSLNGAIASSLKNGNPIVANPVSGEQDGFVSCTANSQSPSATLRGAIEAAKSRGDGWHVESIFQGHALWTLAMAHAQAATSTVNCAWYHVTNNYPKGNNIGPLTDVNDSGVTFTGANVTGYLYIALTGSGTPFAKTTHNGQNSGVADVNGNVSRAAIGVSSSTSNKNVEAVTLSNPVNIKVTGHGYSTGQALRVNSLGGTTQLNSKVYTITIVDSDNFTLEGVDGSGMTAYTSGGTVSATTFYVLKPSIDINLITSEDSGSYGHWSPTAFSSAFVAIQHTLRTDYPNNAFTLRLGNGSEQVFAWATADDRLRTMSFMPRALGVSSSGTVLMGRDSMSQELATTTLFTLGGNGSSSEQAGIGAKEITSRTNTNNGRSFASSFYVL